MQPLTLEQEVQLDLATHALSARPHLLTFRRRALWEAGFRSVAQLRQVETGHRVVVAGLVINAQRPPTAKGMRFVVLEDETGRLQVALPPKIAEALRPALAESRILAVGGRIERSAGHVTLLALRLQPLVTPHVELRTLEPLDESKDTKHPDSYHHRQHRTC